MVSAGGARLRKSESGYWVEVEGENVSVVLPHRDLEGCEPLSGARTCVLLFAVANGQRTGILVDSVSRIEAMEERRVRRETDGPLQANVLVKAKILVGEKWIGVLDVGRLTGGG
jgi:chemotaxis signal transduction protein